MMVQDIEKSSSPVDVAERSKAPVFSVQKVAGFNPAREYNVLCNNCTLVWFLDYLFTKKTDKKTQP